MEIGNAWSNITRNFGIADGFNNRVLNRLIVLNVHQPVPHTPQCQKKASRDQGPDFQNFLRS